MVLVRKYLRQPSRIPGISMPGGVTVVRSAVGKAEVGFLS